MVAPVKQRIPEEPGELKALGAAVIEHALVVITDAAGKITFVNDKFCAVSKYSREELLGADVRIVNSVHHPKSFIQDLWATITAGRTWHGEFRNRAKDLSYFWVSMTIMPQLDEKGKPSAYISIGTDITEHVALRKVSAAFETVMETSTDHIFFKNRDSRFIRVNQANLRHLGVSHVDELRGKTDLDFFTQEHALAAAQDEMAILRGGEPILNKEEKEIHSDGRITWALTSKMPWRDKEGKLVGIVGVSKDITELKQARMETEQWQSRFKFLLESLPLGISWAQVAEDGHTLNQMINDEHLRICGLTREQAKLWDQFRRITHPEDLKRQDEFNLQIAFGKIDRFSMEKRYLKPDGQPTWVRFCYRMRNCGDGNVEDVYAVVDITDRKIAEEEAHVSVALISLAGQMAKLAFWVVELPGHAMRWSGQVGQIFGTPSEAQPTLEETLRFFAPESRETFRNAFETCARDGTPADLALEMITTAGRRIRARMLMQAEFQDDRPHRILGVMRDFTGDEKEPRGRQ